MSARPLRMADWRRCGRAVPAGLVILDPAHLLMFATGIAPHLGPELQRRFLPVQLRRQESGSWTRSPDQIERRLDRDRARVVAALVWAADHVRHAGFALHPVEVPSYVEFGQVLGGLLMALHPDDAEELEGAWAALPDLLLRGRPNDEDVALLGLLASVPQDSPGIWPHLRPGQLLRRLQDDPACEPYREPLASLAETGSRRARETRLGMRLAALVQNGAVHDRIGVEERPHCNGGKAYRAGVRTLLERARDKGVELRQGQVGDLIGRLRARYAALWTWGDAQAAVGRHLLWTPGGRRVQLRPATAPRPGTTRHPRPPALPTLLAGIAQAWEADALLLSLATLAPHLDDLGMTLVLHLHDCTVWEVQEARAEHARTTVTNVMQAAHAWVQQWEPRPGAPPRDRGEGSWAGAPVATAIGESWGESSPKCGGDAEWLNHPAPRRCTAQPTRTNRGSERDGETP